MRVKRGLARLLVLSFLVTLPAVAQLDSAALRGKFGAPLNRETFHMPAGFDLVADYGANSQVCKLQVPALMPSTEKVRNASVMKQRMYDFLSELVPDSIRGKELGRGTNGMSAVSDVSIEYEKVIVSELQVGRPLSRENTITITFRRDDCRGAPVP